MKSSKWLLAVGAMTAIAGLSGCAYDPYYDNYGYGAYPQGRYAYDPGYYVGPPAVSFGFGYSDRRWDGRRGRGDGDHHWRDERREGEHHPRDNGDSRG